MSVLVAGWVSGSMIWHGRGFERLFHRGQKASSLTLATRPNPFPDLQDEAHSHQAHQQSPMVHISIQYEVGWFSFPLTIKENKRHGDSV